MLSIIVLVTSVAQLLLSLFVLLKRKNSLTNVLFALLGFATLGWVLANYAAVGVFESPSVIYVARFTIFFVVLQNTLFYMFARTYPENAWPHSKLRLILYLIFSLTAAAATLSPYVFKSAVLVNGQPSTEAGPLILIFILHAMISITFAFYSLIKKFKHSHGLQRNQLQLLLLASTLNWIVVPFTNFVITLTAGTAIFIFLSPFYTLAFIGMIAYSIVSQKLFDIRAVVARSVAYALLIFAVAGIYGATLFGIINVVFSGPENELVRQVLSLVVVFPMLLAFQPLQKLINGLTRRIFYRDSYDTQKVLDSVGEVVVAEVELKAITQKISKVLTDAFKSNFIEFVVLNDGKVYRDIIADEKLRQNVDPILEKLKSKPQEVLIDEVGQHTSTYTVLSKNNIALTLRLKTQNETVGYVLFGSKKSGDIYTRQDVKLLNVIANELAIAVQNALQFDEIQSFNITLQKKIDKATAELRQTNEKLRQLDEAKDEFISMASHQLRTPLTSMKGYISMVIDGDAGKVNKDQKELLEEAFFSSQKMVYLIADMLNVSRLKTGKFIIEPSEVDLPELVRQEVIQLKGTAKSRDIKLNYDKPSRFPKVWLDETKTRQVVMNFADNALHYTKSGGSVTVNLKATRDNIEFTVVDTGIGVSKEDAHKLFTKFFRASNARKSRPDGTGLGLYMAQKVVSAQGGSVIFESELGKGSTFGFRFPLSRIKNKPRAKKTPSTE